LDPGAHIACFWQFLLRTPRVLWVCRVPLVSAVGGGLLVASTAQTRDMFADLGLEWWRWLVFLVATLGWAWIVHWAAGHASAEIIRALEASTGPAEREHP
jgi:hypothetical protein